MIYHFLKLFKTIIIQSINPVKLKITTFCHFHCYLLSLNRCLYIFFMVCKNWVIKNFNQFFVSLQAIKVMFSVFKYFSRSSPIYLKDISITLLNSWNCTLSVSFNLFVSSFTVIEVLLDIQQVINFYIHHHDTLYILERIVISFGFLTIFFISFNRELASSSNLSLIALFFLINLKRFLISVSAFTFSGSC